MRRARSLARGTEACKQNPFRRVRRVDSGISVTYDSRPCREPYWGYSRASSLRLRPAISLRQPRQLRLPRRVSLPLKLPALRPCRLPSRPRAMRPPGQRSLMATGPVCPYPARSNLQPVRKPRSRGGRLRVVSGGAAGCDRLICT